MRWKTIIDTTKNKVYELWNKDKYVLKLTYNADANTARINSAHDKRLFIIRKEGFLKNKTVLRNEYGYLVGKLGQENKENFIELDGERFFYTINDQSSELVIYKDNAEQPLFTCDLSPVTGKNTPLLQKANDTISLLASLCWLSFQPFALNKTKELTPA